jgi:hypothetical protein
MTFIHATLDGKKIAFHDGTEFLAQIGKGKSAYRTKYRFTGNLAQAVFYFNAINIGLGFKKRLIAPSMNKPLLARAFS